MLQYLTSSTLIPGIFYSSFIISIISIYIYLSNIISRGNGRLESEVNYTVTILLCLIIFFVWLDKLAPSISQNVSMSEALDWIDTNMLLLTILGYGLIKIISWLIGLFNYLDSRHPVLFERYMFIGAVTCLVGIELIFLSRKYL